MKKRAVNVFVFAAILILGLNFSGYCDRQYTVWQHFSRGTGCYASWNTGNYYFSIGANRHTDNQGRSIISYLIRYDDGNIAYTIAQGGGFIPAGDLKGSPNNKMFLDTDTRYNPDVTRLVGPGIVISIEFEADQKSNTVHNGPFHITYVNPGEQIFHLGRKYSTLQSSPGKASGTMYGFYLDEQDSSARLQRYHHVYIEVNIYPNK